MQRSATAKRVRIGGKLRRLRQENRLNQTQMAAELGISPSYLNLIEGDRRPVTVRVLLRLAERFQVDISDLGSDVDERLIGDLMDALADPSFEKHDVKGSDVRELVATLPNLAQALLALYQSHRSVAQRPAASDAVSEPGVVSLPTEEVTDFVEHRRNYFEDLERAAEALWTDNQLALHNLPNDLVRTLSQRYAVDVEVAPADRMSGLLRNYNPLTRRLQLSEMLPIPSRTFQLAYQIGFLACRDTIERLMTSGKLTSPEADALARSALANYFAAAVMMPYDRFFDAARSTRHDINVLKHRFGVSFEQVCHRLTTLQRPGHEGIPFHLLRVDIAGNISKRFSGSGLHISRFGAACPRWNVYDAFSTPGMVRVQLSQTPDGKTYFCLARTVRPPGRCAPRGLTERGRMLSVGLGCDVIHASNIIYADGLNLGDPGIVTPIGTSCRTCPRTDCSERASPSLSQRLVIDENRRGLSPFSLSI